jgi:hypothetical protein
MKRSQFWLLTGAILASVCPPGNAAQDTVVVFNEVMYNPPGTEESGEWIEVHNQMGVNVDISKWAITGGIDFAFAEGTVIPGGGYLVISNTPNAANGELGPFTGALSNGGEELVLIDNSKRPMSILNYGDSGRWPVEADGSGFTLAKIDRDTLSSEPDNWTWSEQPNGTPGAENFPDAPPDRPIVFNEHAAPTDVAFFAELTNSGIRMVDLQGNKLRSSASDKEYTIPTLLLEPGGFVFLEKLALPFETISAGDRLFMLTADEQSLVAAIEIRDQPRGRHPNGTGEWQFPDAKSPGGANVFSISSDVVINEIMYHFPPQYPEPGVPDLLSPRSILKIDEEWKYETSGTDLGAAWRGASYDDSAWPVGKGVIGYELGTLPAPILTDIPRGTSATYYFRKTFEYSGNLNAPISLRVLADDGAVVYVNGIEVGRVRMANGAVNHETLADDSIGNADYETIVVDENPLVEGTNTIAVEVHQQRTTDSDMVFGLELDDQVVEKEGVPDVPYLERDEEWIELHNKGSQPVDLNRWEIRGGISYNFPEGTTIPAGGHLVVSNDSTALRAKWPDASIIGDFTGILNNNGDRIRLKDADNNTIDFVRYYDGGSWDGKADGDGSSLELMDPDSQNANGGAWSASDETGKAEWIDVAYTGTSSRVSGASPPTAWHEFVMGLLDAGELLIDDISVIEDPFGSAEERLQNSDFSAGADAWRFRGSHGLHGRTQVVDDPDNEGNQVLHVESTGGHDHKHDLIETTFGDGARVRTNTEYKISYRAKWLSGSPQLNTRIYFFHLARTRVLPIPQNLGTPGAPNSRVIENHGPVYAGFTHTPVVPKENVPVRFSVAAEDVDGVDSLTLKWLVDEDDTTFKDAPMTLNTESGNWEVLVPGQAEGKLLHVYVEGKDGLGAVTTWPQAGAEDRALIRIDDGRAEDGPAYNLRILLRDEEVDKLHLATNVMSNHRQKATIVFNEKDVYYNVGIRLKGSQRGRNQSSRVGFNIRFPSENKFRGLHRTIAIDRSGAGNEYSQKEILVKHAMSRAGGLPGMYDDLIHLVAPRRQQNGGAMLLIAKFANEFLDGTYENGSRGHTFEYELIYFPTSSTGGKEGLKRPEPDSVTGVNLNKLGDGDNKEHYRWYYLKKNNTAADNYEYLMEALRVMGLSPSSDEYKSKISEVLDVDQWLRASGMATLFGAGDNYINGSQHNGIFYIRPSDNRMLYFPWDMDFLFNNNFPTSMSGNSDLSALLRNPVYKRAYFGHLDDMLTTTFNDAYFDPWVEHYGEYLTRDDLSTHGRNIRSRSTSARRNVDRAFDPDDYEFAITTNDGNDMEVDSLTATLTGTGWINVRSIRLAGTTEPLPLTWTEDADFWQLEVQLSPGVNDIVLEALDFQGSAGTVEAPVGTDSIKITSTAVLTTEPARAQNLVLSEIMYNPAGATEAEAAAGFVDGDDFEFAELLNIGSQTIDLSGVRFASGIDFDFGELASNELAPGARVVIASKIGAFEKRYGKGIAVGDYGGRFNNGGEMVRLIGVNGAIREFTYRDTDPWPAGADGEGFSLVLQSPGTNPDHSLAASWAAGTQTNGSPGTEDGSGTTLADWLATNGIAGPNVDTNGDGIPAIFDFAFGADLANVPATALVPQPLLVESGGQSYPAIQYTARNDAAGLALSVETSQSLDSWALAAGLVPVTNQNNGDGTTTVVMRAANPAGETDIYFRLKVVSQ